eukprot:9173538-Pyramimonas_sp.AAC.1
MQRNHPAPRPRQETSNSRAGLIGMRTSMASAASCLQVALVARRANIHRAASRSGSSRRAASTAARAAADVEIAHPPSCLGGG